MPNIQKKRKKILYLGLDPSRYVCEGELTHVPLIHILPRSFNEVKNTFQNIHTYSHFLFTSRNAIEIFVDYCQKADPSLEGLRKKTHIAIGKASELRLRDFSLESTYVASVETSEGVVELLKKLNLKEAFIFFPRSSLSREVIVTYLLEQKIAHEAISLYDTLPNPAVLPNLREFDEIVFTSPSTVKSFLEIAPLPPRDKCIAIGPITENFINAEFIKIE